MVLAEVLNVAVDNIVNQLIDEDIKNDYTKEVTRRNWFEDI